MQTLLKEYANKYGYTPTMQELYSLYSSGSINLTGKQENELLAYFENNNLN